MAAIPNLSGTRDQFPGIEFPWGCNRVVQAIMQAMGSDGEQQMKLRLLTNCLPPIVWPSS